MTPIKDGDGDPRERNQEDLYQLIPLKREEGDKNRETRKSEGEEENSEDEKQENVKDLLTPEEVERILGPEEYTHCGMGMLRGECLQRLASPFTYLLLSSVVALIQGIFYTYANATLTTVEKRFYLPSKISGLVMAGNDVIQLVLAIPLSYVAGRGRRPRWLALSMMGAVLGCLLAALPHFLFGTVDSNGVVHDSGAFTQVSNNMLCGDGGNRSECKEETPDYGLEQYTVVTLYLLAQMLAGVASLLYYSIGYSYLDDSVSKDKIPLFLAVAGSVRMLGPVCGYSLAAWSLSFWVYPSITPEIHPRHPHWIGAWWLGYLIVGSLLLVVSWSLALLPRVLPATRKRALDNLTEAARSGGAKALHSLATTFRPVNTKGFRGLAGSLRRLLTNPVFMLVCINQVFFWFAFFGYITFKAKFLEHQFKMSAVRANQYIAGAAFAATLAGWLVTGAALSLLKPRTKLVLSFMVILSSINCVLHFCMMNVSCDHDVIHGMDLVLQERNPLLNTSFHEARVLPVGDGGRCSSRCGCTGRFSPVCVAGTHNYYSGCHAGCSNVTKLKDKRVYENCTCIPTDFVTPTATSSALTSAATEEGWGGSSAVEGYCSHDCPTFYMYLTLTVLTKMTHAASRVPLNIMLFRCVDERDKDLGLGVFNAIIALCASIPAPIVFGWAIDYACLLWEEKCGALGFCWLYDVDTFRRVLHGIPGGLMLCCLLTEIILLTMHKTIHLYGPALISTPSPLSATPLTTTTTEDSLVSKEA